MPGMIGRWHGLVIDCPDPQALATFYQELLGMIRLDDSPGWVTIGDAPDRPGARSWSSRWAQVLPGGGERFRVYADPAGHPFCLVL
jgi:hypothetical protein